MSDNKFAQRMAETGLVPEAFALAVLGGDWQSADKMLREVFPKVPRRKRCGSTRRISWRSLR